MLPCSHFPVRSSLGGPTCSLVCLLACAIKARAAVLEHLMECCDLDLTSCPAHTA